MNPAQDAAGPAGTGSLLVLTGPPGAGKSTVARILSEQAARSALVQGDHFFTFLARGAVQPWLPAAHEQNEVVLAAAAAAAGRFSDGGFTTVYDGVVTPRSLTRFLAATGLQELAYAVLLPPVGTCVHRVRTRTGHGFRDEAATRWMYGEFTGPDVEARHVLPLDEENPQEVAGRLAAAHSRGQLDVGVPTG